MVESFRCPLITILTHKHNMNSNFTWEEAVMVYIDVLQNPNASFMSIKIAKEELIILARGADKAIAQNDATEL